MDYVRTELLEHVLIPGVLEYDQSDTCARSDMETCVFCAPEITQKARQNEVTPNVSYNVLFS